MHPVICPNIGQIKGSSLTPGTCSFHLAAVVEEMVMGVAVRLKGRAGWTSGKRRCQGTRLGAGSWWQENLGREPSNEAGESFEVEEAARGLRSQCHHDRRL